MKKQVRVRFAPSPTGPLHIGGLKTALINYIFAKQMGGEFLLRIEDTDQKRLVPGSEQYIKNALKWIGITDIVSVPRQSSRLKRYKQSIDLMLKEKTAYIAFDTPKDLENIKEGAIRNNGFFTYNFLWRSNRKLSNSFTMTEKEVEELIKKGIPYVIRFKSDGNGNPVESKDYLRKKTRVTRTTLEDIVLIKSDGYPTYHFASVVDDYDYDISHVIRGSEWLSSFPLHVELYKALNFSLPEFIHIPLIMRPDGTKKLSKRDGDELGFPVFPLAYGSSDVVLQKDGFKEKGVLPEALLNYLILLGWNEKGGNNTMFSFEDLLKKFSIDRIRTTNSCFDLKMLNNINKNWIKKLSTEDININISTSMNRFLPSTAPYISDYILSMELLQETKNKLTNLEPLEIYKMVRYLYFKPEQYLNVKEISEKHLDYKDVLKEFVIYCGSLEEFGDIKDINQSLDIFIEKVGYKKYDFFKLLRLTLMGSISGYSLDSILKFFGNKEVENRISLFLFLDM